MEVFFLAFANNEASPLPNLKEEAEAVYNEAWTKARDRHFMPFYAPYASVKQIIEKMNECRGQITMFLYSGHANDTKILLNDGVGDTKGIAMYLKESVDTGVLKLVVLNGCATKKAVSDFLHLGVPVVIATQGKINDGHAAAFSKAFFSSLIKEERSIVDSFGDGLKAAQSGNIPLDLSKRDLLLPDDLAQIDDDAPLWEICTLEPGFVHRTIIPAFNKEQLKFRVNEKLLKTIYTSFYNAGNARIAELWNKEQASEQQASPQGKLNSVKKAQKENAICESAPMPIAIQLESLLGSQVNSPNQKSQHLFRLGQLFHIISEFLGIIMISQLWEIKLKCSSFIIPDDIRKELGLFFRPVKRESFNYTPLIISIRNYILSNIHSQEIKDTIKKQKIVADFSTINELAFQSVCDRLLAIRRLLIADLPAETVNNLAYEAEEELCKLFSMLGFIHKYELHSIHNIETLKKRFEQKSETKYRHSMFSLSQTAADDLFITSSDYMDSYGQVVVRRDPDKKDWMTDFLNLSPFIIDINAFEDKFNTPRIMFFDAPVGNNTYRFRDIRNPNAAEDKKEVYKRPDGMYEQILDEMQAFQSTML